MVFKMLYYIQHLIWNICSVYNFTITSRHLWLQFVNDFESFTQNRLTYKSLFLFQSIQQKTFYTQIFTYVKQVTGYSNRYVQIVNAFHLHQIFINTLILLMLSYQSPCAVANLFITIATSSVTESIHIWPFLSQNIYISHFNGIFLLLSNSLVLIRSI